jgi:hypothetical protein
MPRHDESPLDRKGAFIPIKLKSVYFSHYFTRVEIFWIKHYRLFFVPPHGAEFLRSWQLLSPSRNFSAFIEPKDSLSWLQEPATGPHNNKTMRAIVSPKQSHEVLIPTLEREEFRKHGYLLSHRKLQNTLTLTRGSQTAYCVDCLCRTTWIKAKGKFTHILNYVN